MRTMRRSVLEPIAKKSHAEERVLRKALGNLKTIFMYLRRDLLD